MANTYTQLYVQFVFAVKGRQSLIQEAFRDELEKVICGIVTNHNCKVYAIYCNPDHTHILINMSPTLSPSKLMEQVKSSSSLWLNKKGYLKGKFSWQKGFGAFSYAQSQIENVINYISRQPEIHKKRSFQKEYLELLERFEIEFNPDYTFNWLEE